MERAIKCFRKTIILMVAIAIFLCANKYYPDISVKALSGGGRVTDENGFEWEYWVEDDGTISLMYFSGKDDKNIIVPATLDGYKVSRMTDDAFYYYDKEDGSYLKVESIVFSEGITYVNGMWGCKKLKKIVLPSTTKEIGGWAFRDCISLKEIDIPSSVKTILGYAFAGCTSLEKIALPWGIDCIYPCTFENCEKLKNINIPDTVTEISWEAFSGCSSLTGISIPASVKKIGYEAFSSCTELKKVTIYNDEILFGSDNDVFENCPNLTIYGHEGSTAEVYAKANGIPFKTISKIADISSCNIILSNDTYICNGKGKKPKVTIKTGKRVLNKRNYIIKYIHNARPGTATVVVKGKGKYTGTLKKTFTINMATPKVTAKNVNSGIKVSWNRISGVKGYYVYRRTVNGKWKKIATIKSARKLYYYDKKAKSGTTYRYTVRAYRGTVKSSYKATSKIKCK